MYRGISPFRALASLALTVSAGSAAAAGAGGAEGITVAPRWGKIWLSPRLTANWVNLKYRGAPRTGTPPVGDVFIELPAGIRCLWVFETGGHVSHSDLDFRETRTKAGRTRITLPSLPLDGSRGMYLYMSTDLAPGTTGTGRSWTESEGGKSAVSEFSVEVIDVPVARQPQTVMTGIAMWPYMIDNWPDFYAQFASLGFSQMNLWHGAIHVSGYHPQGEAPPDVQATLDYVTRVATSGRKHGFMVSIDASTSWDAALLNEDPDAQALFVNGTRAGPCPSYRGPGFIEQIRRNAAVALSGISYIQSDEETYGGGNYATACVCSRCDERWKKWLAVSRPDLVYASPREVIERREDLPEVYRAWLWFRASLTTERYRIYQEELRRAAAQAEVRSSPRPLMGWWAAAVEDHTLAVCMQDGRALAEVIDQVIPQLYFRYQMPPRHFRDAIRRQAWALDGKNCYAGIDSDAAAANVPGNLALAVLETLFAGGDGYCVWYGPYTDTRQWAELARVNDVVAKHEQTFLEGSETDLFRAFFPVDIKGLPKHYFRPWSDDVCIATWESAAEGLLLIADYRQERSPIWVERSRKYAGPMTLRDAFSGAKVVDLTQGQWDFRIHLDELPVRLLVWDKNHVAR